MKRLLEVSGVSVTFDGFRAINNLSIQIGQPELRAVIAGYDTLKPSEVIRRLTPLAQEGEAIYHIGYFKQPDTVAEHVELLQDNLVTTEQSQP